MFLTGFQWFNFSLSNWKEGINIKIGIPKALTYYKNAAMWTVFLESLGMDVVCSPRTNRAILDDGIKLAVDESCLPVKIYLGHIKHLINFVDYIFVSRQQNIEDNEVLCTKLWGIPDIVRNTFDDIKLLELNISPVVEKISDRKAWINVGRQLKKSNREINSAYKKACSAQALYEKHLVNGLSYEDALKNAKDGKIPDDSNKTARKDSKLKVALLGHAYITNDDMFGKPIFEALQKLDVEILIVEGISKKTTRSLGRQLSPTLNWTYNREIIGAAEHYLQNGIDGIIFIEAFPCGPDALVLDLTMRKLEGRLPMMKLVLDELQSQSSIQTRLESFIDILIMRKEEHNLSAN